MEYQQVLPAVFIERTNRFVALCMLEGHPVTAHVKNTGRCRELLTPGAAVFLQYQPAPGRKTQYTLTHVQKGKRLVHIDSQAPNRLAEEWIAEGGLLEDVTFIKREQKYGSSRFDLYVEAAGEKWFIEVKGVTLNVGGTAMFPDAPTERGKKHVEELIACQKDGYRAGILFVIQMKGVSRFTPFEERQPEFAEALRLAQKAGVMIRAVDCIVERDGIRIDNDVAVRL